MFTTTLVNTLLLTQVVLGAALTGLGASNSSRVLITVFGALNTIIAGVIAFLKSRGQPMRARMFRDDLSRVVDEIENSAVMWYGISTTAHGYGAIDTDDQVTVRSEVARLTRLYDKAVKMNTMNDPDMYSGGSGGDSSYSAGLRKSPGVVAQPPPGTNNEAPVIAPDTQDSVSQPLTAIPVVADPDASPASKAPEPPKPKEDNDTHSPVETSKQTASTEDGKFPDTPGAKNSIHEEAPESKGKQGAPASNSADLAPSSNPVMAHDPDASPANAAHLPKKEDSQQSAKTLVNDPRS